MRHLFHIITIAALGATTTTVNAQSLKELFLKMPQQVCPVLSEYNRLEIVDNQKNGKEMKTRNLLRTLSTMEQLTDDYALMRLTDKTKREMKMLHMDKGDNIIMVISTVTSDSIADSSVAFYSTSWQPLSHTAYFSEAQSTQFRTISTSPTANVLTVTTTHPLVLTTDGSNRQASVEPTTETFTWNGASFQRDM